MPILFAYVCDLLEELERLQHYDIPLSARRKQEEQNEAIKKWFQNHRKLIDSEDTDRAALLSTLLPGLRSDRMYGVKETRLGQVLSRCLGLGSTRIERLKSWNPAINIDFGEHIYHIVKETDPGTLPTVKVEELDNALHRLAAMCRWSSPKVRLAKPAEDERRMHLVLGPVVRRMLGKEAKWLTRIVLKNLGGVNIFEPLVLRCLHPILPEVMKIQKSFEAAVSVLQQPDLVALTSEGRFRFDHIPSDLLKSILRPIVGIQISRPEFVKARSTDHCSKLAGGGLWSVEQKIDGESCQIHIDLSKGKDWIQLFSKSGKDSTQDRAAVHDAIRKSLKIDSKPGFSKRCILEGELVVFRPTKDNTFKILEFHKIRKHVTRSGSAIGTEVDSPMDSRERLGLVLYDVHLIDDDAVMFQSYVERRSRLAKIADFVPGRIHRGDWGTVDFGAVRPDKLAKELQRAFAKSVASRFEGLVLKSADAPYHSIGNYESGKHKGSVIKFKKDYIPGLGDCADFAIVGATWDVRDGQKISRPRIIYTSYTIACLENKEEVTLSRARPVFKLVGVIGPGCVSEVNMQYLSQHGPFEAVLNNDENRQKYDFDLKVDRFDRAPEYLFKTPFVGEVLGSSFERPSSKAHYMLRHPRITKIHSDRGYVDVVSFTELQDLAKQAVEIPSDVLQEEKACLERLCTAEEPKRKRYVSTYSPFSDKATPEVTSAALKTPKIFGAVQYASSSVMSSTPKASISNNVPSVDKTPTSVTTLPTDMKLGSSNQAVQEPSAKRIALSDASNSPGATATMTPPKRKSDETVDAKENQPPTKKVALDICDPGRDVLRLTGQGPQTASPKAPSQSSGGLLERAFGAQSPLAKIASRLDPSSMLFCKQWTSSTKGPSLSPGKPRSPGEEVRGANVQLGKASASFGNEDSARRKPTSSKASAKTTKKRERDAHEVAAQPPPKRRIVNSPSSPHLSRSQKGGVESLSSKTAQHQKRGRSSTKYVKSTSSSSDFPKGSLEARTTNLSQERQQPRPLCPDRGSQHSIRQRTSGEFKCEFGQDAQDDASKEDGFARMWLELLPEMTVFSDEEDLDAADAP
ncbi:MAG: hypothetical protein M1831_002359 [Alyxoria varia]|nr:MAG: hypothetical protein M1831_002359 [Alyxoria varia]